MMSEHPRVIVVIPAYNEGRRIQRAIRLVRKTSIPVNFIVVDDGSRDNTAQKAREMGAIVVQFIARGGEKVEKLDNDRQVIGHRIAKKGEPINRGKTAAFMAGMRAAARLNPSVVVTFDADMLKIPTEGLASLTKWGENATQEKRSQMIIGGQVEGESGNSATKVSGIRAYSLPAVHEILRSRLKKYPKRFGLEPFLNDLFRGRTVEAHWHGFHTMQPWRRGKSTALGQHRDTQRMYSKLHTPKRPQHRRGVRKG